MLTMKYGEIVKYNNELGELVTDDGKFYFHPVNYGSYYCSNLDEVTEKDIQETTTEEKIDYIEMEYTWGTVIKTHCIGEYQIIEEEDEKGEKGYHAYINFKDTNSTYETLDNALIGVIAEKHLEVNAARYATSFILKMLKRAE